MFLFVAKVEVSSPNSTDLSDPEEIKRKLYEILCKPDDHVEEMKRLQEFVKSKSNYLF